MISIFLQTGQIIIPLREGTYCFYPADIIRLEAGSNYTRIYFNNHKPLLTARVLREFEVLLRCHGFIRTHRSHLVNRRHITRIDGGGQIIMSDASRAVVSRRRKLRLTGMPAAA